MKKFFSIIAILSLVFSPVTPAFAVDVVWDGSASALWALGDNWVGSSVPDDADRAVFNSAGGGNTTIDLGGIAGQTIGSILFDDATAAAYTIGIFGADTLELGNGGGILVENDVALTQTIAAAVVLGNPDDGSNGTFSNYAADNGVWLRITGPVSGDEDGPGTLTLEGSNTGSNIVSGIISDGDEDGSLGVIKDGVGTWILSGTNTYSGVTTISAGILELSGGAAILDAGAVSLANAAGAILQLNDAETIGSLNGGGTTGGNVVMGGNLLTIGGASNSLYHGKITGTAGLTKTGAGTLTLDNILNAISGNFTLTTTGANDATIVNTLTTNLAASSIGQDLTITTNTAGANITDSGTITVGRNAYFTTSAANDDIDLGTLAVTGDIFVSTNGATGNATLVNATGIDFITASTVGGNLNATATLGSITDVGTLTVGGTTTLETSQANEDITVNGLASTGAVSLNTDGATGDATVVNTTALDLAASNIGGNLAATATAGNLTDSGIATVGGTGSFTTSTANDDIDLGSLAVTGDIFVSTNGATGNATLVNATGIDFITASTVGGNLNATATLGSITDVGTLTVGGTTTLETSQANEDITVNGLASTGAVSLNTDGATGDATVVNTTALDLAASNIGGNLAATATDGDITNSGALVIGGDSTFTAATGHSINVANAGNNFTGTVAFVGTGGSLLNVSVLDTTALDLEALTITGNLAATATAGSITDSGALTVGSSASFTAVGAGGAVTLNDNLNGVENLSINTVGSFAVTGDNTTELTDLTIAVDPATGASTYALTSFSGTTLGLTDSGADLNLGANTLDLNFNLTAKTGSITDSGVSTISGTSSFTTTAADADITFDQASTYGGAVSFNTHAGAGNDVSLTNANGALNLGAATVGGTYAVATTTGSITDSGVLAITGASHFTVATDGNDITLDQASTYGGAVSFDTHAGAGNDVSLTNANGALNLGAATVGGTYAVATTTGSITDSGVLAITGASNFAVTTAGDDITLDQISTYTGAVSFTAAGAGSDVSLTNANAALNLGAATVGGTLTIETNAGSITDSGVITASGTSSFTTSTADDDITLNSGLAATGAITLSTAGTDGDATIVNTVATTLAASTIGGDLSVDSSDNSLTVSGALSTAAANGALTLDAGTDTLTTNAALAAGTGKVTLTADTVDVNANIAAAGGEVELNAAMIADLNAASSITTTAVGANSGAIDINASGTGTVNLAGNLVTTGAANGAGVGYTGGAVTIDADDGVVAVNNITTTGGAGTGAAGGAAGNITINTSADIITLNGNLTALGGAGDSQGAGGVITVSDPALLGADVTISSGTGNINLTSVNTGGHLLTITNTGASAGAITGVISNTGDLTKTGTGTLTLSANNTYTGTTTVSGGTLALSHEAMTNNISGSTTIDVADGAELDATGLIGGRFALADGQTLTGEGIVTTGVGGLVIGEGSTLAPGASPGELDSVGDVTYGPGGTYTWEIDLAGGAAGTNWDLHDISGGLTITSTPESLFTIDITSLTGGGASGEVSDFDKYTSYSWDIATTVDGITDFDAGLFNVETTHFENDFSGGSFDIDFDVTEHNLQIIYTAAADNRIYWVGTTDADWGTATNWNPDTAAPGTGDVAVFNAAAGVGGAVINLSGQTVEGVWFNNAATAAYTIGAGGAGVDTLTLDNGGRIMMTVDNNADQLFNANLILGTDGTTQTFTFTNNSVGNTLTVAGNITGSTGDGVKTLVINGTDNTTLSGIIANGAGEGTVALTTNGTGTTTLSSANTYTGATTIGAGSTLALGATGSIATSSGVANSGTFTTAAATTIDSLTGAGTTTIGGTLTIGDVTGTDCTYSGVIGDGAGTFGLIKAGEGELTLSGNNTYGGVTTINAGALSLMGDNTAATGGVTLTAGTLNIGSATALGTGTLTINGGTIDNTSGAALTLTTNNVQAWNADFTFTGTDDLNLGTGAVTLGDDCQVTVSENALTVGGAIGDGANDYDLIKDGDGPLILNGINTYSGSTIINAGTLAINQAFDGNIDFTGDATLGLAGGQNYGGDITTTDGEGTLQISAGGDSNIGGAVGTTDDRLKAIEIELEALQTATFAGDVHAETIALSDDGSVVFSGDADADDLSFTGDGTAQFDGAADFSGAVTTATTGEGTLVLKGDSTIAGDVGTSALRLREIEMAVALAEEATLDGNVFATTATINGTGTTNFNGNLTGNLDFMADGEVNLAAGRNIVGAVTNSSLGVAGELNFLGSSTTGGNIGAAGVGALREVNVTGGTLTLGHNIFARDTNVSGAANLSLSGNRAITGDLTLDDTASLTLGTNTLTLGGTGIFTMGPGQTLNLSIADAATYGRIVAAGNADVTGGTIHVAVINNELAGGLPFLVLDSAGGAITMPTITDDSYTLSFTGAAAGGDITLTSVRTHTLDTLPGENSNTAAVGAALEGARATASGDMLDVLTILDNMGSTQEIETALETMHPDVSSGAMQGARTINGQFLTAISNRLAYARSGFASGSGLATGDMFQGAGFWMQGLGSHVRQGERGGIEGYSANTFGTSIGIDKLLDKHVRMGVAAGYGFAAINSKTPGSPSAHVNSWQATVYGSYDSVNLDEARSNRKYSRTAVRNQCERLWYVDGMLSFTQNGYDSRREIDLGTEQRVAKADNNAQQYSTKFETGYTFMFDQTKNLEVTPFASLAYNFLYMNKYKENGADALNLHVDGQGYNQLEQGLGLKFAYPIISEKGTFIPAIKGAWLFDYLADRFETTASFAGGGPAFSTYGVKPSRSGFLLGAEIAFLSKGNMTLTGNFDWLLRDQFASYTYYLTARFDF